MNISFFYEHPDFWGESKRTIVNANDSSDVVIHPCASSLTTARLKDEFQQGRVVVDRAGVLLGEYVVLGELALIDRAGNVIKIGHSQNDVSLGDSIDRRLQTDEYRHTINNIVAGWDGLAVVEGAPLMSHPFHYNYYHYLLELIPKFRYFEKKNIEFFLMPDSHLQKPFQLSALLAYIGNRPVRTYSQPLRIRNPQLITHSLPMVSCESIEWLRKKNVLRATKSTGRNIYIRRTTRGISETENFLLFLKRYKFEIINFGDGDLTIEQQSHLLDGASVILAAHGAGMTNMVFLDGDITVIEVIGTKYVCAAFMHLATILKFKYFSVISSDYGSDGNAVVNIDVLDRLMLDQGI